MLGQWKYNTGQDIVEYALALPLLLLLTFSIVEGGILFFNYNTVANAAREGARAAVIPAPSGEACESFRRDRAEAAAQRLTVGLDAASLEIDVEPGCPNGAAIAVTVRYDSALLTGIIISALGGTDTIQLESTATMQIE